ncbi:MAG TPA: hypothetical protein PKN75_14750 [Bacteroidia bacterium]|nr:hypothetical protein [Bacteroidia bacterium]HNU34845.1 hypothetical protein [Bacteroidia bacterium]
MIKKIKSAGQVFLFTIVLPFFISHTLLAQEIRWVDDIVADSLQDGVTFKLCNTEAQIIQYFNNGKGAEYLGGKPAIDSLFFTSYHKVHTDISGMIRIRFVVNCLGETGRFRLLSADSNYQPVVFPDAVNSQLMQITKSMNGWQTKLWKDVKIDYYQNLIFRIEQGQLTNIIV